MSLDSFHALTVGTIDDPQGARALTVHDLGVLRLPSGRLEANDPFVNLGESAVVEVAPGDHPVKVTVADVSDAQDGSHLREAYLSVVLAEGAVARVESMGLGVGVDAGTVAFVDHEAVARCMPEGTSWYEGVFDDGTDTSWFSLMDSPDHMVAGCANIVMPLAPDGENVVLSHSGWGDGYYPILQSFDAEGTLLGVHIDLCVVGEDEDDPDAVDVPSLVEPVPPPKPAGLFKRHFGR